MKTPATPASFKRSIELIKVIIELSPARALVSAGLLIGGTLFEGLSLAFLLPLFHFIGHTGHTTLMTVPTGPLSPLLGPTLSFELWFVLTIYCGLITLVALFNRFKAYYVASLFSEVINKIRVDLFRSVAMTRWSTVTAMRKADLDHALTGDIDRVQLAISSLYAICQIGVACAIYAALSAFLSLKMTVFALLAGLVVFILQRPLRQRAALFGEKLTQERRVQYRTISDFLGALKVAKSYNAEDRYATTLSATLSSLRAETLKYVSFSANGTLIYQVAAAVAASLFIYVSYVIYHVEFARILILLLVFMRIAPRATELQSQFQVVMANLPAFESMQQIRATCDADREPTEASAQAMQLRETLTFTNIGFSHGSTPILHDLSFVISACSLTAITGPSGAGKTTLADLAMGLLLPSEGSISVDGSRLLAEDMRSWRSRTAYVPQETYLIAASLADNLRLAAPDASLADMRMALEQARALTFVEAMPQGLETRVGDGGIPLSGGERQRISLARALLKKPALLVLDEVTSALDRANTRGIIETLTTLKGEMTVLLITHDAALDAVADQVIHIDKGQIVDIVSRTSVKDG